MQIRVVSAAIATVPCRTRLPFRFGATTVTAAPLLHARVHIEGVDGQEASGIAADLLVPRWFRKDVARTPAEDAAALNAEVAAAACALLEHGHADCWSHWQLLHQLRVESLPAADPQRLERGFGTALLERALIDATCRLARKSFWSALHAGTLGQPPAPLPDGPTDRVPIRHTVGMLDPLGPDEIDPAVIDDDQPRCLEDVLAVHGVRWLKVKIGGGFEHDRVRLLRLAELLRPRLPGLGLTVDGNEQFQDLASLRELWAAVAAEPIGRALLDRVHWVEQPLPRGLPVPPGQWPHGPLVLDEGDCGRDAFATSGYDGVSVKNCKGVFVALHNRAFCAAHPGRFQTAEDLTNLPIAALQQDLTTLTSLALPHAERNGHHYFHGLDHLPPAVVAAALTAHDDLYEPTARGARLRIRDGAISCRSLLGPGYGIDQTVVDALFTHLDWQPL